jgi:hypothetical protein
MVTNSGQGLADWLSTIPNEALVDGDRELIRDRWSRALDQGFTIDKGTRAAFDPLPTVEPKQPRPRPMSNVALEHERGMTSAELDQKWQLEQFGRTMAEWKHDQQRRLPAVIAVLAALGLPEQAARVRDYIERAIATGAWR